jgi:hypothetical protein
MKRPTLEQLKEYAAQIGYKEFNAELFLAHYNATGWRVGVAPMKSWKHVVQSWKLLQPQFSRRQSPPRMPYRQRENRINYLNRRKAELMRLKQTPEVQRELTRIQIELHKL